MQNLLMGLTFLVIGDSHFASPRYLITTLHDALLQRGAKVATYGACGVPAGAWVAPRVTPCGNAVRVERGAIKEENGNKAHSWSVDQLVGQVKPNIVVVGIGDTMAGYNQKVFPKEWITEQVTALTTRLRADNVRCIWVGPGWGTEGGPYFKTFARVKELSDLLSTVVAPCEYIDSLTLSKPGEWSTFDGQHYSAVGYQKWGEALGMAIANSATVRSLRR